MVRRYSTTFSGARGFVLDVIAEPPPSWPGERWFQDDLDYLDRKALFEERDRIRLRLRLTPEREQRHWPAAWFHERIERIEKLLRPPHEARRTAGTPR